MQPVSPLPVPSSRPRGRSWIAGIVVLVGSLVIGTLALATPQSRGLVAFLREPPVASQSGLADPAPRPAAAYAFMGADVVRVDPATGGVLARRPYHLATQSPHLAVSPDGQAVFVLDSGSDGTRVIDRLTVLSGDTLTPLLSVPVDDYARYPSAWPPALAVTSDSRTVAVYHISQRDGAGEQTAPWLTFVDRATGAFTPDMLKLPGRGVAHLLPAGNRLAVVCFLASDVRLIDAATRQGSSAGGC